MEYQEYLQSAEWKQKANEAKQRAGNRCQLCNASAKECTLHVHHRTYERLGSEEPMDLTVLCQICHARFHAHLQKPTYEALEKILRKHGVLPLAELPVETRAWSLYERAKLLTKEWLSQGATWDSLYYEHCMQFVVNYLGV